MSEPPESKKAGLIFLPDKTKMMDHGIGLAEVVGADCELVKVGTFVMYFPPMLEGPWGRDGAVIKEENIYGIVKDPWKELREQEAEDAKAEAKAAAELEEMRANPPSDPEASTYGLCPVCMAPGSKVEDDETICEKGHRYPNNERVYSADVEE